MLKNFYVEAEKRVVHFFQKYSILCLRSSMGLIFVWYGLLKILKMSPVEELVYHATQWIQAPQFVIILGVWEVLIGICLWVKKYNRLGLFLLFLQFPGTFLPLFLNPEDCFTHIPFGLTLEGQYIFKNLILISAGFVLISDLHRKID